MAIETVLVVDDIALMRRMLVNYIALIGASSPDCDRGRTRFEVVEAGNGAEALEAISQRAVDLIFLDLMMPEMDGITFLERAKTQLAAAHIPVVVTTAIGEDAAVDKAMALGARACIRKPFTIEAVRGELAPFLAESGRGPA